MATITEKADEDAQPRTPRRDSARALSCAARSDRHRSCQKRLVLAASMFPRSSTVDLRSRRIWRCDLPVRLQLSRAMVNMQAQFDLWIVRKKPRPRSRYCAKRRDVSVM